MFRAVIPHLIGLKFRLYLRTVVILEKNCYFKGSKIPSNERMKVILCNTLQHDSDKKEIKRAISSHRKIDFEAESCKVE